MSQCAVYNFLLL